MSLATAHVPDPGAGSSAGRVVEFGVEVATGKIAAFLPVIVALSILTTSPAAAAVTVTATRV